MNLLSSLRNRIFLASALLAVLCIGVAIYLVNARVTEEAERTLDREMVATAALVDNLRTTRTETFTLMARFIAAGPPSIAELAVLVAASTVTALVFFKLRLPGGLMFGAMLASAILHGAGFIHSILPWWVAYAAVIGIGAVTGSRFANTDPYTLLRFLGAALGSFAVAMAIA